MVRFPQEETGRLHKLSRPWHGPYRIIERRDPDVTVVKVYAPQDGQIQVHQMRVAPCPPEFPAGFYWYGSRRSSPGRPPKWVNRLLNGDLFGEPEAEKMEHRPKSTTKFLNETEHETHGYEVTRQVDQTEELTNGDEDTSLDVSLPQEDDRVVGLTQESPDSDAGVDAERPDTKGTMRYNLRRKRTPRKRQ